MTDNKIKNRAPSNRTITIDSTEIDALSRVIVTPDKVKAGVPADAIINGDIFECIDSLPDKFFNLIIVDPPYNLSKTFNSSKFTAMDDRRYEDYLRSWFYKICDKLADNGTLYMCGDWKCSSSMQRVIAEKLVILNRITWQREKGRGASSNWKNAMEDIWFAVKNPKDYYFDVDAVKMKRRVLAPYKDKGQPKDWQQTREGNFRITYPSNFWDDISVPFWSMPENTDHPRQKPEKLVAKLILASSKPGDYIFDPFLGSGTTAVVARKLGRKFCGVEIDRDYCLLGAKRLVLAEKNKTIQGYNDGVFWERNSLADQKIKTAGKPKPWDDKTAVPPTLF